MNEKTFFKLSISIFILYLILLTMTSIYDSDMYFLIASGREILQNGILRTNIWTIDKNCDIIIQQWLYDVVLAIFNKFNDIGLTAFILIQLGIFFGMVWHFMTIKNIKKGMKYLTIVTLTIFGQIYLFSLRPELITLILLLAECLCLEHYRLSNKIQWLCGIIPIMLFEINFHASMWPIHFLILLAYCIPAFYLPQVQNNSLFDKLPKILTVIPALILVMFINPYGIDSILYIIKAMMSDTFDVIRIEEVLDPTFLSAPGCGIILTIALTFLCIHFKTIKSTTLNICVGFTFAAVYAMRNNMFLVIAYIFVLTDLAEYIQTINIDWKKDIKNNLWFILLPCNILLFTINIATLSNNITSTLDNWSYNWNEIYAEIQKDYNPDMHVFTGFNCGGFFEYKGMKNLYMDARPELYTKDFNHSKDILTDYSEYCIYGFNNKIKKRIITKDNINKWFDNYNFDYIIVSIRSEMALNAYMKTRDDYELIESVSDSEFALYKKKEL